MDQNWRLTEPRFEGIKSLLTGWSPLISLILLGEIRQGFRNLGESLNKSPVKVRESQELLCPFDSRSGSRRQRLPSLDCPDLLWGERDALVTDNIPQIVDVLHMESTFVDGHTKIGLLELFQYIRYQTDMLLFRF